MTEEQEKCRRCGLDEAGPAGPFCGTNDPLGLERKGNPARARAAYAARKAFEEMTDDERWHMVHRLIEKEEAVDGTRGPTALEIELREQIGQLKRLVGELENRLANVDVHNDFVGEVVGHKQRSFVAEAAPTVEQLELDGWEVLERSEAPFRELRRLRMSRGWLYELENQGAINLTYVPGPPLPEAEQRASILLRRLLDDLEEKWKRLLENDPRDRLDKHVDRLGSLNERLSDLEEHVGRLGSLIERLERKVSQVSHGEPPNEPT